MALTISVQQPNSQVNIVSSSSFISYSSNSNFKLDIITIPQEEGTPVEILQRASLLNRTHKEREKHPKKVKTKIKKTFLPYPLNYTALIFFSLFKCWSKERSVHKVISQFERYQIVALLYFFLEKTFLRQQTQLLKLRLSNHLL